MYVICAEIFPTRIRAICMSITMGNVFILILTIYIQPK